MNDRHHAGWGSRPASLGDTLLTRRQVMPLLSSARASVLVGSWTAPATATATSSGPQATPTGLSQVLFTDDFHDGFQAEGSGADWSYFVLPSANGAPVFTGNNGSVSISEEGLQVRAPGTHPETGEPVGWRPRICLATTPHPVTSSSSPLVSPVAPLAPWDTPSVQQFVTRRTTCGSPLLRSTRSTLRRSWSMTSG